MRSFAVSLALFAACAAPADEPSVARVRFKALEGGLESKPVVVVLERTGSAAGEVTVRFTTRDGSARAGEDYSAVDGTVSWPDGELGDRRIEIPVIQDDIYEPVETFMIDVFDPSGAELDPASAISIEKQLRSDDPDSLGRTKMSALLRILDDDPAPAPSVVEISRTALDTSDGYAMGVTIARTGSTRGEVSVDYETLEETAAAGVDFLAARGTLRWGDAEASETTVRIPLLPEATPGRTFQLVLMNGAGDVVLGESRTTITIPDLSRQPIASASADVLAGEAPLEVRFDGSGSSDPDGAIVAYQWTFGDGASAEGAVATHVFAEAGIFAVLLTVTDGDGLASSAPLEIAVTAPSNLPPIADAGPPIAAVDADGDGVETVVLDGSSSYDPDGTITAYDWYLESVLLASEAAPSVSLPIGQHLVTLRVTDDLGVSASATVMVTVDPSTPPPHAVLLRINAGGAAVTDTLGRAWAADRAYDGATWGYENPPAGSFGAVDRRATDPAFDVGGTADDAIFTTERWGLSAYRANVPNGTYRVTLRFAETWSGVTGPGQRVFGVAIEGIDIAPDLDVFAAVGFAQAYQLVIDGVSVQDQRLDIDFTPNLLSTMIDGLEIAETAIVERRISSGLDDVEENASTGGINATSTDLELAVDNTTTQVVGMRFSAVGIPNGAVITRAHVQFQVDEVSIGDANLVIQAELAGDAAPFTTATGDVSGRARSVASVAWTPPPWPTVDDAGPDQRTPDLTALLQEVVDEPGWASGHAVVLIVSGTGARVAESFDGVATAAPLLHVEYLAP